MSIIECVLCGLYLTGGMSVHRSIAPPPDHEYYWAYDANNTANPYGEVVVGYYLVERPRFTLSASLRHESSIATAHDHGTNSIQLQLTWRPFSR